MLIVELARREGTSVRCAGAGHSPSDLACTQGYMIRTDKLDALVEVRRVRCRLDVTRQGLMLPHVRLALLSRFKSSPSD